MKRIAYIVDSVAWVQMQRAEDLRPYLGEYELIPMSPTVAWRAMREVRIPFDAVWLASWRILFAAPELESVLPWEKTLASVTSHYQIGGGLKPETCFRKGTDPAEEFRKAIEVLGRFPIITCNSRILFEMLVPKLPMTEVVLAQNGVDAEFFTPVPYVARHYGLPTVGWVGKDKGAKNIAAFMATYQKLDHHSALFHMVVPKKRGGPVKTREGMRNFYWQTDFLVCTSWFEGSPNGCLEGASCGLPIITTPVGNMPELVTEGTTGWFIEPTAESLIACVERLQHLEPWKYREMSEAIRAEVERAWAWKIRAEAYRKALEVVCG